MEEQAAVFILADQPIRHVTTQPETNQCAAWKEIRDPRFP